MTVSPYIRPAPRSSPSGRLLNCMPVKITETTVAMNSHRFTRVSGLVRGITPGTAVTSIAPSMTLAPSWSLTNGVKPTRSIRSRSGR